MKAWLPSTLFITAGSKPFLVMMITMMLTMIMMMTMMVVITMMMMTMMMMTMMMVITMMMMVTMVRDLSGSTSQLLQLAHRPSRINPVGPGITIIVARVA